MSASWTPKTKLREILSEEELAFLRDDPNQGDDINRFLDLTAQECNAAAFGALTIGMGACMDMTETQALKRNAEWLPYLSIANNTAVSAVGRMWDKHWPTGEISIDIENLQIAPGTIGRFPLPKTYDIRRDYPHNHLLREREIELLFEDGRSFKIGCNRMNQGICKTSLLIGDDNGRLFLTDVEELQEPKEEVPESEVSKSSGAKLAQFMAYGTSLGVEEDFDMENVKAVLMPVAEAIEAQHTAERKAEEEERKKISQEEVTE
jgi:hypothetical protein